MNNAVDAPHDLSCKKIFSNKPMVESLLRDFVSADIGDLMDFATLRRCSGDQVADGLSEHDCDMIWEVRQKDGTPCYVHLLFESESSADSTMALQVMACTGLLMLELTQKDPSGPLPPILPIVLYNGPNELNAVQDKADLFGPKSESLMSWLPLQRYLLLDAKHISLTELNNSKGLVAQLVKTEQSNDLEHFQTIVREWKELLGAPEYKDLRRDISEWLARFVVTRLNLKGEQIPELQDLQEA